MTDESQFILDATTESMENTVTHLENEFQKIRAGKASPMMLQGVKVEYYGTVVPIEQTSNIGTPDARQIIVQPFDKSSIGAVEKAIMAANLGFNPKNEGEFLRILVPPLTEERRRDLAKRAKTASEEAKIGIRNIRRNSNDDAKKLKDDGVSEDEVKIVTDKIQEITDKFIKKIDELQALKEKDILTV
ncbi:MAG: ribosome recycling factor [Bacteroidales bacterium]|nr:ribosome recycling factor [Bacteroidales bacterium]